MEEQKTNEKEEGGREINDGDEMVADGEARFPPTCIEFWAVDSADHWI